MKKDKNSRFFMINCDKAENNYYDVILMSDNSAHKLSTSFIPFPVQKYEVVKISFRSNGKYFTTTKVKRTNSVKQIARKIAANLINSKTEEELKEIIGTNNGF